MRTIVTGAAGFVGSTLVDRLLAAGHQVIGIDNLKFGSTANLEGALECGATGRFKLLTLDVQAPELIGVVAGVMPSVIFHLAAHVDPQVAVDDPQFDARTNILGTINLCEACRLTDVRRIVYATTTLDTQRSLSSPHVVAKLAGEMYLRSYADRYGLAPVCLAFGSVYGPRQNHCGATHAMAAESSQAHESIHIDEVVDALMHAGCTPDVESGTYCVGAGTRTAALSGWEPRINVGMAV
ncbi:NAD-dependent epimerase/dehydratase family protein [Mycolicibacterium vaccae]|uniref:NAD-dependent epimerase/dehydratase family protein n=1 Tax=Mycolicibacterium vaccae TaxID=1810 RepID=UPI003CEB0AFE